MRPHSIIRTLAAAALIAVPSIALAAPDQNTNPNQYPNNGCPNGQWNNNGQCVNGQWNNGQNGQRNNGRHRDRDDNNNNGRHHDRDDNNNGRHHDGDDNNGRNGSNNGNYNGGYNNGGYNNGGYNNGRGNRSGQLSGSVSSFSPYNLYLSNGTHVELHNGTVINPTGTNLRAGQRVRVIGNWNGDGTFNANEVDVVGNGRYR